MFPKIAGVAFVGSVPGKNRFIDFDQLNDLIYDVATEMKAPKGQYTLYNEKSKPILGVALNFHN